VRLPTSSRGERVLGLLLLASLPLVNPYIRGEGHGNYAYLRSLAVDGDLHFENEYRRGDPDFVTSNFRRADGHLWPPMRMPGGRVRNQWPSGAALLWAPAFLQVHAAALALRALGMSVPADGYALAYRLACAAATAVYGGLALLIAARAATRVVRRPAALLAAGGLWLASPLPVYMYFLPFYAHVPAAFAASVFLGWWLARRPLVRARDWAVWGAAFGLLVAIDHFAVPLLLVPVIEWTRDAWHRGRGNAPKVVEMGRRGAAFAAAAFVLALPEMAAKWILHGSPLRSGRLTRFYWSEPHLWETGFSTQHGAFLWTPLLLAAAAGLVLLVRRDRATGAPLLCASLAYYYLVASYELWHGSSSFGIRYFVTLTPVLVIGLAALLDAAHDVARTIAPRLRWPVLAAPLALLAAWNAGLMFQWGTGMMPRQGAVDPAVVARNQVEGVPRRIASFALRYLRSREQTAQEPPAPE
jgi:hypothetical protein